ncbi:MAG: UDP-N-acetylmuramoyl-L-alanine--D-glutamate ligase [Thermodesulfobacteriota bacterium]
MPLIFKNKKTLVVGLGKTGMALVSFVLGQGARVLVSDSREVSEIEALLAPFLAKGASLVWEGGGHSEVFFSKAEVILVSPGIPLDLPALEAAREKGIPIWGEVEVFAQYSKTPVVAVTGTNGKTTTTALLNEMLVRSGKNTYLGGNIGQPLVDYLLGGQGRDLVVAEISSFQLDTTVSFAPEVGLLLNISADHLDRYADFNAYAASKASLFRNQKAGDAAVICWDDPLCRAVGEKLSGPVYYYSRKEKVSLGAYLRGTRGHICLEGPAEEYELEGLKLPGTHNQENALAAILGARLMGAEPDAVQQGLVSFKGFGHRLEFVAEVKGVNFYDDSKATNVGAVDKALEGFDQPVILIAGGRDKGGDYYPLEEMVKAKVKALILIGEAKERIKGQLGWITQTEEATSLPEAVRLAAKLGRPGDVVLLSPACSSFDMFRDYAQRGKVFQEEVRALEGEALHE